MSKIYIKQTFHNYKNFLSHFKSISYKNLQIVKKIKILKNCKKIQIVNKNYKKYQILRDYQIKKNITENRVNKFNLNY